MEANTAMILAPFIAQYHKLQKANLFLAGQNNNAANSSIDLFADKHDASSTTN